jgi:Uma2 family endonuclease
MTANPPLLTTADLLALPDDGKDRWLIRGRLREKEMTKRNRFHARVEARIAHLLLNWVDRQPEPRGEVYSGEAGVWLAREPDTSVGIDVVYVSAEVVASQMDNTTLIEGVPTLAVEILSPSDTQEELNEKIDAYLAVGVPLVWVVEPYRQHVTVYRPGEVAEFFTIRDELSADPHLPGFAVPVARLFRRP